MNKRLAVALIGFMLAATSGYAVGQIIPPLTLDKRRIVIRNIRKCDATSVLVGRGDWNAKRQVRREYVCRNRTSVKLGNVRSR